MLKYTYKCNECGHAHTALHSMSKKLSDCLECGCCDSLERVVTVINLQTEEDASTQAPGQLVKKTIEDTREQISELQQEMINGTTKN